MTETTAIDFGRMDALTASISQANQGITGALTRLDDDVSLLRSGWTGEASDAYDAAHREWTSLLAELNRILAEIARTSGDITSRHRAAEQAAKGHWG